MTQAVFLALLLVLVATRLCHVDILWAEEDLPLATAIQMLHGKVIYRDVWFDKPPLTSAIYLLWGARDGWILRVAGALWFLAAAFLVYCFAAKLWGEREGRLAACALVFFLIFGIPSSVIPLAADSLMMVPHLAAVYLACRGRAFWSGFAAGLALLFNAKAVLVLAACAVWAYGSLPALLAGFAVPCIAAIGWLGAHGALYDYYLQVWRLGGMYAKDTFLPHPFQTGFVRTVNWAGFHASLVVAAIWYWLRGRDPGRFRLLVWATLSLVSVALGWRFFSRYYLQLLPVFTLAAARGFFLLGRRGRALVAVALLLPMVRFGPRYALLAQDLMQGRPHQWRDVAMNQDSRQAALLIARLAKPGDTLFVWGFRPDVFVYTRMPAGTRFLECQPLTGVFADRHLFQSSATAPEWAKANRTELQHELPTFVVDGLAAYNPQLAIDTFPDLNSWLSHYEDVGHTEKTRIYRLKPPGLNGFSSFPKSASP